MTKLLLLVAVTLAALATAAAQTRYCGSAFYTCNPNGMPEGTNEPYTTCTSTTAKTVCKGAAPNAKCTMSLRAYKTICCYDIVNPVTPATPSPGSTFSTPTAATLVRDLKPICPNGARGYGTGNLVLPCNRTNLVKAGCPNSNYTCTRAMNVYDVYGTPADLTDDVGAANTPDICCSKQTYSNVFADAGLTPSIVPVAPTQGVAAFYLPGPKVNVYLGDDRSNMANQLSTLDSAVVTLLSNTEIPSATDRYHVLFFDASTNKDCVFYGNIPGSGTPKLELPPAESIYDLVAEGNGTASNMSAVVFTNDTTTALASKSYMYASPYGDVVIFGPANKEAHKFSVLVWHTSDIQNFGTGNSTKADTAKILLGVGPYADFVPTTDKVNGIPSGGKFTTVSAFLAGKGKLLGTPIAGTYFWFKK